MMTELDDVLDDFHFAVSKTKELEQQVTALVDALDNVEYVSDPARNGSMCPWCSHPKPGHWNDCQRQQAIALVEGSER